MTIQNCYPTWKSLCFHRRAAWMSAAKRKQGNLLFTAKHSLQHSLVHYGSNSDLLLRKGAKHAPQAARDGGSEGLLSKRSSSWCTSEPWWGLRQPQHWVCVTNAPFPPPVVMSIVIVYNGLHREAQNPSWSNSHLDHHPYLSKDEPCTVK